MMEPIGPLDQLAMCCGLNLRGQKAGFDRAFHQQRNYYYSPSIAHMNALVGSGPQLAPAAMPIAGWPMAGTVPFLQPQAAQPYLLVTQPVIFAAPQQQQQQSQTSATEPSLKVQDRHGSGNLDEQKQRAQQQQMVTLGRPLAMQAPMSSQYAICYQQQPASAASIYDSPRQLNQRQQHMQLQQSLKNDRSMSYLAETSGRELIGGQRGSKISGTRRLPRALNAEIFERLEVIEKQADLSQEMEMVERYSMVITRAIDPYTLMPHLTPETLRQYQTHFLLSDDYVIRFIEIIKRPGQTLGLYIRTVQFEHPNTRSIREGLVVTKIESDSPIYSSRVLHVGDEILSINLIDVQGMSLDDVVIIMSIPKRLVLALRIPKDRDQLMPEIGTLPKPAKARPMDDFGPASSFQSMAGLGLSPRQPNSGIMTALHNKELQSRTVDSMHFSPSISRSLSRQQTGVLNGAQQFAQTEDGNRALNQSMIGAVSENQKAVNLTLDDQVDLRGCDQTKSDRQDCESPSLARSKQQQQQQRSMMGQFERQMAISHSSDAAEQNQPAGPLGPGSSLFEAIEPNQFSSASFQTRNSSFDQELANLEREAMNKERPKMPALTSDDRIPTFQELAPTPYNASQRLVKDDDLSTQKIGMAGPNIGEAMVHSEQSRASSTLPRRILPDLPDEQFESLPSSSSRQHYIESSSNPSTLRRPIINNIRLGTTSEQSSYFSSSIEAINRELKELRLQRIALDIEDQSNSATSDDPSKSSTKVRREI